MWTQIDQYWNKRTHRFRAECPKLSFDLRTHSFPTQSCMRMHNRSHEWKIFILISIVIRGIMWIASLTIPFFLVIRFSNFELKRFFIDSFLKRHKHICMSPGSNFTFCWYIWIISEKHWKGILNWFSMNISESMHFMTMYVSNFWICVWTIALSLSMKNIDTKENMYDYYFI